MVFNKVYMRKLIIVVAFIFIAIISLLLIYQSRNCELITDEITKISGFIYGIDYECDNKETIKEFVDIINKSKKRKTLLFHQTCQSPEMILYFWDSSDQKMAILVYGDYLVYEKNQYIIKFEQLHDQLVSVIDK